MTLPSANTYSGATTIYGGGTVIIGDKTSLGAGNITAYGLCTLKSTTDLTGANKLSNTMQLGPNAGGPTETVTFSGPESIEIGGDITCEWTGHRIVTNNLDSGRSLTFHNVRLPATAAIQRTLTIAGSGDTHIAGAIANSPVVNPSSLTKEGAGTLTLSGTNTYDGTTLVNGGLLKLDSAEALGFGGFAVGGTVVSNGYTLDLNGTTGVIEPITLYGAGLGGNGALVNNSGTPASLDTGVAGLSVAGVSTGSGYSSPPSAIVSGSGSGAAGVATLGITSNTFSIVSGGAYTNKPTATISGGGGYGGIVTLQFTGTGTLGDPWVISGFTVTTAGREYTSTPTITLSAPKAGETAANLAANDSNFAVSAVRVTAAGSGYSGATTYSFSAGDAVPGAVTLPTVTLGSSSTIGGSGDLAIHTVISGAGNFALTKAGAGTLTLSAVNTYNGDTIINSGKVLVSGSLSGTGLVTVAGGTLGGTGTVRSVAVSTGGRIAPGASIGTLHASNVTWDAGTAWPFELGAASSGDLLACAGSFIKGSGAGFTIDLQNTGVAGTYTIVTWAASTTFVDADFAALNVPGGLTPSFTVQPNELTLTLTSGGGGSPVLGVTPASYDFGSVEVGSVSDVTFVVTNSGTALLTGTASVGGAPFAIASGASYAVAAGGSSNVVISFTPSLAGAYADSVVFLSDGGGSTNAVAGLGYIVAGSTNGSIARVGSNVQVVFNLTSGALYRVQASTNLLNGASWSDITLPLTNRTGASVPFSDTNSAQYPARAYRVRSP